MKYDNSAMPAVVFTDPQVARVGLTEATARAQGIDVKTSGVAFGFRSAGAGSTRHPGPYQNGGRVRERSNHRPSCISPEGADTIQTGAIAIRAGMTTKELGGMVYPYLTTVEGLKLAAQKFEKDVKQLSCCAG